MDRREPASREGRRSRRTLAGAALLHVLFTVLLGASAVPRPEPAAGAVAVAPYARVEPGLDAAPAQGGIALARRGTGHGLPGGRSTAPTGFVPASGAAVRPAAGPRAGAILPRRVPPARSANRPPYYATAPPLTGR